MSKQLEILLRQSGLVTEASLNRAKERSEQGAGSVLDVLIREERLSEEAVADLFVTKLKVPRVRVAAVLLDPEAMKKVPDRLARKHICLPLTVEGRVLVLAMMNPLDYHAIQDIEFAAALAVRPVVATRTEVADGIEERYEAENRIGSFLANVPEVQGLQIVSGDAPDQPTDVADTKTAAEVAPVVKMCNLVIYDAIRSVASDVHIEPALHDVQLRMRVDGVLRDYTRVPKWLHGPLVSRLKILAKLDIAERRLPQDGRINVHYQGRSIDLRVSTLPTHFGEKVVLRVLGGLVAPKIDRLGLSPEQQLTLESAVAQPQGLILVTGPTGSGKSTTLYALLSKHHRPEINIVTVEDPIEYQLPGINQVQINTKAGLTFAGVLRSILRQDPDVILVGEMRDRETSEIACQAAMTGHMVLSTLHTNSAVAAISRLLDLGVDPSIISTSISLVIAQRLVRRICGDCREEYEPNPNVLTRIGLGADHEPVFRGAGCGSCGNTGYAGRVGLYEFFRPTTNIRKLINDRASEAEIRSAARQVGMVLLREDALVKIKAGLTSPDEVLRVVQVDEHEVPCPNCGTNIEADFLTCPYCRHSLKTTCAECGQSLKLDWKVCPYCNSNALVQPVAEDPRGTASSRGPERDEPVFRPPAPSPSFSSPGAPAPEWDQPWRWVRTIDPDDVPAPAAFEPPAYAPPVPPRRPAPPVAARPAAPPRSAPPPVARAIEPPPAPPAVLAPEPPVAVPPPVARAIEPPAVAPAIEPPPPAPPAVLAPEPPVAVPPPAVAPALEVEPVEPAPAVPPAVPRAVPRAVPPILPFVLPAESQDARPAVPPPPQRPDSKGARPIRVLVVDDDRDIRMIVGATLRKLPVPVQIMEAEDGADAVEQAMANPPDMVVLDVMMPRMDGFATCRALREHVRTAFVPILMLTASADQGSRTQGYLVGTDDYMSKPFLPVDLNLRVMRLLRRTYGI